jgi:enoyl-CoA hydratase/carnithine racemase
LEEAASCDDVRAVLTTGFGDSYTSGNDINDFQPPSAGEFTAGPLGFGDRLSLVNRMLPPGALLYHATGAAKALAAKPPGALAQTRALLRGDLAPLLARKQQEAEIFEPRRRSPETQAIFAAS